MIVYVVEPTVMSCSAAVLVAGTATVGCYGSDYFAMTWKFKGLMVTDGRRHALRGDNLTISQVQRSDSGTYECMAFNEK